MERAPRRHLDPEEVSGHVERTLAGDRQAFEALVEGYHVMAWSIAYSVLKEPDGAQEVAQQAWVEAYANLVQLRERGRFGGWLARIVRLRAYSYLSDRHRRTVSLDRIDPEGLPQRREPEEPACETAAAEWVRKAVADLPERYRQIFLLKHLDGRSYEEIAQMTGLSAKGVATRLTRARRMLIDRWQRSQRPNGPNGLGGHR